MLAVAWRYFNQSIGTALLGICAVMAMLLLIILKVSTTLLDIAMATNFLLALLCFLNALYIKNASSLTTLPSLILLGTLFRIATNVASIRIILIEGQSGTIVENLGETLSQGNPVVGFVTFIVISLMNFIIIAKGSERVAEVSARFSLDAIPGSQMSIDADVRAGILSSDEAGVARRQILQESRFFGALDGAMKFVKGDIIAGWLILVVCLAGGVVTGLFIKGMTFNQALVRYATLTIGDGLAVQIPCLLMSLSAGFVVTQIGSEGQVKEESDKFILQIMHHEWFSNPTVLLFLLILSCILMFFLESGRLFFALVFSSLVVRLAGIFKNKEELEKLKSESLATSHKKWSAHSPLTIELILPKNWDSLLRSPSRDTRPDLWAISIQNLCDHIDHVWGIKIPAPALEIHSSDLPHINLLIKIQGVTLVHQENLMSHLTLQLESVHSDAVIQSHSEKNLIISERLRDEFFKRFIKEVYKALFDHLKNFVGVQEIRTLLHSVAEHSPDMISEFYPKKVTLSFLRDIVHRGLDEGITLHHFTRICEALTLQNFDRQTPAQAYEIIRSHLSLVISGLVSAQGHLNCLVIEPSLEDMLEQNIKDEGEERILQLDPEQLGYIRSVFLAFVNGHLKTSSRVVIVTRSRIRRTVWFLIQEYKRSCFVVTPHEILPHIKMTVQDTIAMA